MCWVNAILVIHNDVYSNRVNPMTYELLQKACAYACACVDGPVYIQCIAITFYLGAH